LFEVADERTVFENECERGLEWKLERASEIFADVVVDLVTAILKNFSRIENVSWIERLFNLAQYPEQLVPELIAHVFGARDADAVLGGKRTFELSHQRRCLIGDLPELFQVHRAVQIEHGANVEQTTGSVTVVTRLHAKRVH